jgi:hypothetical protein
MFPELLGWQGNRAGPLQGKEAPPVQPAGRCRNIFRCSAVNPLGRVYSTSGPLDYPQGECE